MFNTKTPKYFRKNSFSPFLNDKVKHFNDEKKKYYCHLVTGPETEMTVRPLLVDNSKDLVFFFFLRLFLTCSIQTVHSTKISKFCLIVFILSISDDLITVIRPPVSKVMHIQRLTLMHRLVFLADD